MEMKVKDFVWWANFRENLKNTLSNDEYINICDMHAYYFNHAVTRPCKCNPKIIQSYIDELNELFLK
jgi:hypothetical protein